MDERLTVEQARNTVVLCARNLTNYPTIEMAVDNLIAAVRAENDAEVQDLITRAERYMAELRDAAS